jgi:hypothetical protein
MEASALALERQVFKTQGWLAASVHPRTGQDRNVVNALKAALGAQGAYAGYLANFPPDAGSLSRRQANAAIGKAQAADDAYQQLAGTSNRFPAMPINRTDHQHLLELVHKPRPPTPTVPTTRPSSSADKRAIEQAVSAHWQAINNGNYTLAFSYFSPSFQSRVTRGGWIADKDQDQPIERNLAFQGVDVRGSTASVDLTFETRGQYTSADNSGCNSWVGSYSMALVRGQWLIDGSSLRRTSLDCSTY